MICVIMGSLFFFILETRILCFVYVWWLLITVGKFMRTCVVRWSNFFELALWYLPFKRFIKKIIRTKSQLANPFILALWSTFTFNYCCVLVFFIGICSFWIFCPSMIVVPYSGVFLFLYHIFWIMWYKCPSLVYLFWIRWWLVDR